MTKKLLLTALLATCLVAGCGKAGIKKEQNSEIEQDWSYEKIEKQFGGIIETDCISVRDCLKELSWKDYYIYGIVVETNKYSSSILTLSEDLEAKTSYQITVSQGENDNYYAKVGEVVYVKAQNINSYDDSYHLSTETINLDDGYVSKEKPDKEYLSVMEFLQLMEKIYDDTYFKTEGIIMQDGEDSDGQPEYFLYPSEEGYKEDKLSRVELKFKNKYSNLNGKHVTIMGNPDKNATFQGLRNCNITDGDSVEQITEENNEESDANVLFQKEYEVDGEEVSLSLDENNGKTSINVFGYAENEEKATVLFATCLSVLKKVGVDNFNISVFCGELSALYMSADDKNYIIGTNKDGSYTHSMPDWLVTEFTTPEEKLEAYSKKITKVLNSFAEDMSNQALN